MNRRPFTSPDWRRDLRTFAAGAGCGLLGGAALVATVLWQFHWITPPWAGAGRPAIVRSGDPGATGIEAAERPAAWRQATAIDKHPTLNAPHDLRVAPHFGVR